MPPAERGQPVPYFMLYILIVLTSVACSRVKTSNVLGSMVLLLLSANGRPLWTPDSTCNEAQLPQSTYYPYETIKFQERTNRTDFIPQHRRGIRVVLEDTTDDAGGL